MPLPVIAAEGEWSAVGMYTSLRRITTEQLASLQTNPGLTARYVDPDDDEYGWAEGFPQGPVLDLDKSWQVLHYLLNGDPVGGEPPLKDAVMGRTAIGESMAYGHAHYLTPDQVSAVANALNGIEETRLRAAFDPAKLDEAKVYPGAWLPRIPAPEPKGLFRGRNARSEAIAQARSRQMTEFLDFAMGRYRALVAFYHEAATKGEAVLVWIA
ncbi:MAG TPA: YfbM family protein [Thermoplasmata archaeon]|nr:YfbM family protein [Thermoplasmata archaeon]